MFPGSWRGTALFALSLAAIYVYFSSGQDSYAKFAHVVFHTIAGMAIYALLVLNLALAGLRVVIGRLGRAGGGPSAIREMDVYGEFPLSGENAKEKVASWLRQQGCSVYSSGEDIYGTKGRLSFIPGTLMRAGIVVFMASLVLSVHLRRSEEALLREGESAALLNTEVRLEKLEPGLPGEFLQVGDSDAFRLEKVSAGIATSAGETITATGGFPTWAGGLYWRITHLGYHQPVKTGGGETGFYLDVLPPGKGHSVRLSESGPSIVFKLEPEKTIKKGLLTGKLYRLDAPFYRIGLKGEDTVMRLGPGESGGAGGLELSLGESSLYIRVLAVYDPALRWIWVGIVLALVGLALMPARFFWYEKRFHAHVSGGSVLVGYSQEFYRNWSVHKFQRRVEGPDSPFRPG
jgi:hypothetical protein